MKTTMTLIKTIKSTNPRPLKNAYSLVLLALSPRDSFVLPEGAARANLVHFTRSTSENTRPMCIWFLSVLYHDAKTVWNSLELIIIIF